MTFDSMYHYHIMFAGKSTTIKTRMHAIKVRSISLWIDRDARKKNQCGAEPNERGQNWQKNDITMAHRQSVATLFGIYMFAQNSTQLIYFCLSIYFTKMVQCLYSQRRQLRVEGWSERCRCVMCRTHIHLIFALFIFS